MGQFKPMVKMETTEPSVILKLAKGGHVNMKKGGKTESGYKKMASGGMGALSMMSDTPALVGRPAVNAPVRAPGRPSMAMRRKAMMAKAPAVMPPMPPMKKGGKAEGGKMDESKDKAMIKKAFKQHDTQEHKGGKGTKLALKKGGKMATGGVVKGQGGFATGGVALGNAGGYKDGGMMGGGMMDDGMSGYGGYKKGGSAKKAYATGGSVNSGRPVAMPQGAKKPSSPVSINQLSGTFKKGGKVKRMNDGGDAQSKKETKGYKGTYATQKAENIADREAMNPMNYIRPLVDKVKGMFGSADAPGAVTKTKESTTVVPAKRRSGGMVNC